MYSGLAHSGSDPFNLVQKTDCSQINVITIRPVHENKIHHNIIVNPCLRLQWERIGRGREGRGRARAEEESRRGKRRGGRKREGR